MSQALIGGALCMNGYLRLRKRGRVVQECQVGEAYWALFAGAPPETHPAVAGGPSNLLMSRGPAVESVSLVLR